MASRVAETQMLSMVPKCLIDCLESGEVKPRALLQNVD
jgi:hypothetical protein